MPARQLGDPQQFALALAPGQAAVRLEIDLRDDALAGQLAFVQQSVQLETTLANAYGGETLKTRLNQALAQVKQLNVTVDLSGTLRRPRTRLHSDLGPQIADGLTMAARQELQARVEQLTGLVDREVHKHLSELEGLVSSKTDELLARLDAPARNWNNLWLPSRANGSWITSASCRSRSARGNCPSCPVACGSRGSPLRLTRLACGECQRLSGVAPLERRDRAAVVTLVFSPLCFAA